MVVAWDVSEAASIDCWYRFHKTKPRIAPVIRNNRLPLRNTKLLFLTTSAKPLPELSVTRAAGGAGIRRMTVSTKKMLSQDALSRQI